MSVAFKGFPKETRQFYQDLAQNNNRLWFQDHKQDYVRYIQNPAQDFIEVMGEKLRSIAPRITADPDMNRGSIMRIYRDTRFSKDKTPYKTNLGVILHEGPRRKTESPGFYFHLDPESVWIAVGMWIFPKDFMLAYRDAVVDDKLGSELDAALLKINKAGDYKIGAQKYKRLPRGCDPEHPRTTLLFNKGMWVETPPVSWDVVHSPELIDATFERYKNGAPLHHWLVKVDQIALAG
ncbi:MAG: DUF2461 domain-containing protein [Anaerolineales bacterium]|nr:DUF2461 domain-containing protein [Anaerolineales bacterium]